MLEERDDSLVIYVAEKDVKDQRQVARGDSGPSGSHVELALALLGPHVAPWRLCKSSFASYLFSSETNVPVWF